MAMSNHDVVEEGTTDVTGPSRAVRAVCALISAVTTVFALILIVHIVLALAEANPANSFADLIERWSAAVSLGLRDLFTSASPKLQVLFNDGLAAILWLIIGAVLTGLISRLVPGGVRYRRRVIR
jgi:Na+/H+ antiporter NhaA